MVTRNFGKAFGVSDADVGGALDAIETVDVVSVREVDVVDARC